MKIALPPSLIALICLSFPACNLQHDEEGGEHHEAQKIIVTSPLKKDVVTTQQYVCQIHSQRHINIRALENGYLEAISIKEGQSVKAGDELFKVNPALYKARVDAEVAELKYAQQEYNNSAQLKRDNVVSGNALQLLQAKLLKAEAKLKLAQAELNFATVKAPFDGIIDRLHEQQGSLIKEGDILTTLSDNSVMWAYFNVPEARYLEYESGKDKRNESRKIELLLANGEIFPVEGKFGTIEGQFNHETGNIPYRADFANPDRLLRHGQTGVILIRRTVKDALVIPQRATYEILDKRYVYIVDDNHVVHQREIFVDYELEDVFVIQKGITDADKIVLDGVRQVREGQTIESEFRDPKEALTNQKKYAE